MSYHIRFLTNADQNIIWEMLRYAAHESSIESVRNQASLLRYAINWGRPGDLGCVAVDDEQALGAAWVRLSTPDDRGFGYVSDDIPELALAVVPQHQGRGIGTQLLLELIKMAEGQFPGMSLSVRSDNPALRLYERVGFWPVPTSEVINRTGGQSFTMMLKF